jgi:hypothetical protein
MLRNYGPLCIVSSLLISIIVLPALGKTAVSIGYYN